MADFKPGDIVLKVYSKANKLKNRVYLVIGVSEAASGYPRYTVVTPSGKQTTVRRIYIRSFETAIYNMETEIQTLEGQITQRRSTIYKLHKEKEIARSFFPKI